MPKPQSTAHMTVAYDFVDIRNNNRYLREELGRTPRTSKRDIKQIANRGDRRQAKRELLAWLR
tara:strand:+ start:5871 stop:6059 length:189 start_codon:yes stop_codon:yes gene_type:complete